MSKELERYKEALRAVDGLVTSTVGDTRALIQSIVRGALSPPPEMETVEETVGWLNVYALPHESFMYESKERADDLASASRRLDCQEIKVKVQRPKKQPVERSVSMEVGWMINDTNVYPFADGEFFDWKTLVGKTGTLTFTWEEPQS